MPQKVLLDEQMSYKIIFNATLLFALFKLEPVEGSTEMVNKIKFWRKNSAKHFYKRTTASIDTPTNSTTDIS